MMNLWQAATRLPLSVSRLAMAMDPDIASLRLRTNVYAVTIQIIGLFSSTFKIGTIILFQKYVGR